MTVAVAVAVAVAEKEIANKGISDHVRKLVILVFKAIKHQKPDDPTIDSLISIFQSDVPIAEIKFNDETHKDICINHPGGRCTLVTKEGNIRRTGPSL